MSKNKKTVTAPLSYDPGKGRPKEYLAYLNWQEMQALRRLNGNNMERGPMGLPSFPPDWKGPENGTSTGNWSGSGGTTSPGGTTGGGSESGNIGGTESGTTYSAASNAAAAAAASEQASSDTAAQQAAAQQSAAEAARNDAVREDAAKGGIASINVGPMRTPVNIGGGAISAAVQAGIQQAYSGVSPTMPGGGGMGQLNARRGSLTTAVGPTTGVDAFGNIATGSLWGTSPSVARKYDSLESDLARRSLSEAFGAPEKQESYYQNAPSGVFGPRMSMDKTYYPDAPSGATIGPRQYSTPSLSEFDNYPPEFDGIGGPTDRAITQALKDKAYGAYKTISDYFSGQPSDYVADVSSLPQLKVIQPEVRNPSSRRVVGGLGMASLPGGPTTKFFATTPAYGTELRDFAYGGGPKVSTPEGERILTGNAEGLGVEDQIDLRIGPNYVPGEGYVATTDRMGPFNTAHDLGRERVISVENVPEDLTTSAENEIVNTEEQYREQPNGTVGQYTKLDVAPGEGYITHIDGTPFTAEDIANLPPDIKQEYMDKMRWARMTDEPYPLTTEQKIKVGAVGAITRPITGNPLVRALTTTSDLIGTGLSYLRGPVGEFGEQLKTASERLSKPAQAVADYERLNPLQKAQLAANAGQTYQYGTGTTVAGGTPTRELGGKDSPTMLYLYGRPNYPDRYTSYRSEADDDKSALRKQYRLWDMGIGIPEPGDPDYNDYMKYLKSRGTSAQV